MKAQTIWRPSRISRPIWLLLALSATAFANPKEEYKLVSYCELMNLNVTGIRDVQILDKHIVSPEKLTDEQRRNFPSGHVISSKSAF